MSNVKIEITQEQMDVLAARLVKVWSESDVPYSVSHAVDEALSSKIKALPLWDDIASDVNEQFIARRPEIVSKIATSIVDSLASGIGRACSEVTGKIGKKISEIRMY